LFMKLFSDNVGLPSPPCNLLMGFRITYSLMNSMLNSRVRGRHFHPDAAQDWARDDDKNKD
jgi:hypothetical protein